MKDQLGMNQNKVGHGHINNQCEWTTYHFLFTDGFHQLSAETEEKIFHVNMENLLPSVRWGKNWNQDYLLLLLTKKCWKLLKCRIRKVNIEFLHKVLKVRRNADCLLKFSELAAGLKCFISQGYNNAPHDAINHLGYPGASASAYSLDLNFFPCIMFLH